MAERGYDDFDDFDDGLDEIGICYGPPMTDLQTTPLHVAVQRKNISETKGLLRSGANVNACDGQGRSVLQVAVLEDNNEEMIRLLLKYGADVTGSSGPHGNALDHAVRAKLNIMQTLLDHVASQGDDRHAALNSALYYASEKGRAETVTLLLSRGADPSARGLEYGSAIQAAAHFRSKEVVQALPDAGAQVNTQGGYHGNALQAAAMYGRVCLVQMLLNAGADVNARGGIYGNALTAATRRKNTEVVNILLQAGAKDDLSESEGLGGSDMTEDIGGDLFDYAYH